MMTIHEPPAPPLSSPPIPGCRAHPPPPPPPVFVPPLGAGSTGLEAADPLPPPPDPPLPAVTPVPLSVPPPPPPARVIGDDGPCEMTLDFPFPPGPDPGADPLDPAAAAPPPPAQFLLGSPPGRQVPPP